MRFYFVVSLLLLSLSVARAQSHEEQYQQALSDFKSNQYANALARLKILESQGVASSDLYLAIGTAYSKFDSIAPSIYYLEKAKRLAPNNSEIHNNLALMYESTIDKISPMPRLFFVEWWHSTMMQLNSNAWSGLCVVVFWLVMLGLIFALRGWFNFSKSYISLIVLGVVVSAVFAVFALQRYNYEHSTSIAIAMQAKTKGYEQPFTNAEEVFVVHEGCKLWVVESQDGFAKVQLADGREGWVQVGMYKTL
jgi:tetratricopeptide (TPR) repeat protein